MIKLTPIQALHYPTIKFMLDDHRAYGKTELLAYAYIMTALDHPRMKYSPIDFPHNDVRSKRHLLELIVTRAREINLNIQVSKVDMTFWIEGHPNPYLSATLADKILNMGPK